MDVGCFLREIQLLGELTKMAAITFMPSPDAKMIGRSLLDSRYLRKRGANVYC
jgi:hypothetical protein